MKKSIYTKPLTEVSEIIESETILGALSAPLDANSTTGDNLGKRNTGFSEDDEE
jgi:hypothetical protein